jgi:hypothetical protein
MIKFYSPHFLVARMLWEAGDTEPIRVSRGPGQMLSCCGQYWTPVHLDGTRIRETFVLKKSFFFFMKMEK